MQVSTPMGFKRVEPIERNCPLCGRIASIKEIIERADLARDFIITTTRCACPQCGSFEDVREISLRDAVLRR